MVSEKTVGRLTLYRRVLNEVILTGAENIYSHELAAKTGTSAAQVRRDLMTIGFEGSPQRGYGAKKLLESLGVFLDNPACQQWALIGVGNLGLALLSYFRGGRSHMSIAAAFDVDAHKAGRVIAGCRCYSMEELDAVVSREGLCLAIVAVPAEFAQQVAEKLARCGIRGILNFAPVPVQAPSGVYLENMDVTMSLEKVAFFARKNMEKV